MKSIDELKPKRKTKTSSAVKNRFNAKNYKKFQANVKPGMAARIEKYLEQEGISRPEFLERAINALSPDEKGEHKMKKITVEQVMKLLRDTPSAEPEEGGIIRYYLHLTAAGDLVDHLSTGETFVADRDEEEYFAAYPKEDERGDMIGWGDLCAAAEDDPESDFRSICEELTDQANAYLADLDE